jgi:NAD(P)-dependent dehydrogenase (short-subunit alcohol dehydrogenase family)
MGIETPITDRSGEQGWRLPFSPVLGCSGRDLVEAGMPCYVAAMQGPAAETQRVFAPGILNDQVAIVTGGGSGIGLATAHEMVRLGARVAICGRTEGKLEAAAAELRGAGGTVLARACDIREPAQVQELVAAAMAEFGRIDIVVNNAGGQFPSPAQHISPNGFLAVVKNNLVGTFHVCREVANQAMIPAKRGRIVNVIANIYRGFPGMVHTGAARAGVENMTMSLAVEWAQFGILVNAVAPGVIRSSGTARYPPEVVERGIQQTPLKRAGTCEEVAAAIVFLASPAAQFITGATLRLDGGQALWGNTWEIV